MTELSRQSSEDGTAGSRWRKRRNWRRAASWVEPFLVATIVSSLASVFLSGVFLFLGLLAWAADCIDRRKFYLKAPPFKWLLFAFLGLALISICLSGDPWRSLGYMKKFIKLLIIFLTFTYLGKDWIKRGLWGVFLVAGASALLGILQFVWLKEISLLNRIDGFMSHWMTYSGQLMIVSVALAGYLLLLWKFHEPPPRFLRFTLLAVFPLLLAAILLSYTRSAWIGVAAGLVALLAMLRLRWAVLGGFVCLVALLSLPGSFKARLYSSFDPADTTNRVRVELLRTSWKVVAAHPFFGVGPRMAQESALKNRSNHEFPDWAYQHFHNNIAQIAAEVGIPALLVWLCLWLRIVFDFIRLGTCRSNDPFLRCMAMCGVSVIIAFQLMGLFEYNFGDSEVVILPLFFMTVPYAIEVRLLEKNDIQFDGP